MHQIMNTNYAHVEHLHAGHPPTNGSNMEIKIENKAGRRNCVPANKLMASYGIPRLLPWDRE